MHGLIDLSFRRLISITVKHIESSLFIFAAINFSMTIPVTVLLHYISSRRSLTVIKKMTYNNIIVMSNYGNYYSYNLIYIVYIVGYIG